MFMADDPMARPSGVDDIVGASWLILQRLDDLKMQIAEVKQDLADFKRDVNERFATIERRFEAMDGRFNVMDSRWSWSLAVILVMALGLLAKLLRCLGFVPHRPA